MWLILTIILSFVNTRSFAHSFLVIGSILILCLVLIVVVRPLLSWIALKVENSNYYPIWKSSLFAAILVLLMVCAWSTEFIGVHPILGSFLCGTIIPVSSITTMDLITLREIRIFGKSAVNSPHISLKFISSLYILQFLGSVWISRYMIHQQLSVLDYW